MKGIVFTEFIDMVESKFGVEIADRIIEDSNLPSGGAYTGVGTYDHGELVTLLGQLARVVGRPAPELLCAYGEHLFARFVVRYPTFFAESRSCFPFLQRIHDHIHVEVRKLYPDAELPTIETLVTNDHQLELIYRSSRPFGDFAEGLIKGCIAHFREAIDVQKKDMSDGNATHVRFTLTRR